MGKYSVHRSDTNAAALYEYLEARGATVAKVGRPVDAFIGFLGACGAVEVKTPKGRLRASQRAFLLAWRGPWAVLRTFDDVDVFLSCLQRHYLDMTPRLHDLGK